jgi:hypothetical protein
VHGSLWLAPLCAAPVWGLLQLATQRTVYRWGTWNAVLTWTTWLALFFLALQLFQRSAARHWFLRFALYFGAVLSVLATVQMFTSGGKIFWIFPSGYTNEVLGLFVNRNQYAAFLLWQALRDRRLAFANCAIAAAMLASVVAAASRAGSVLMCVEVAAVLLLAWRRGMAPGGRWPAALPRSPPLPCYLPPLPVGTRCGSVSGSRIRPTGGASSWSPRWPCCTTGLPWASDWRTGRAPNPRYAILDDGTYVNQAHNDWLQWAVEGLGDRSAVGVGPLPGRLSAATKTRHRRLVLRVVRSAGRQPQPWRTHPACRGTLRVPPLLGTQGSAPES